MSLTVEPAPVQTVVADRLELVRAPVETSRVVERRRGFGHVLGLREYRSMFLAELFSAVGDQVAAVALAVLLYQRTGSPFVAALGYASAYLPWAVGGPILAVYADRLRTRRVVVGGDALRFVLIGAAAIPGMPLIAIGLLVLGAAFVAPPFESAAASVVRQVLVRPDDYAIAVSIRSTMLQVTSLAGFAGGGLLVVALSAHGALAVDALTFAISAVLLRVGLQDRPAALDGAAQHSLLADAAEGLRAVVSDRRRYGPLLLGMAGASTLVVPEAIATAWARSFGHGAVVVGLILASVAAGRIGGVLVLGRFVSGAKRRRLMWPMALACTLPMLLVITGPGLTITLALLGLAGVGSSFQVAANTAFAAAAPAALRGRVFGVALTGMYAAQGAAVLAAGAAAQVLAPNTVVTGAAVLGAISILALRRATDWRLDRE